MKPEFIVDDLGRSIPAEPPPRRLLSLVPSVTELLFDLGLGSAVVGRTDFCISPEGSCSLPSVGGPKRIDVDRVGQLRPDLILANAEENRREEVEELIARGFRVHVAFPRTVPAAARFLRALGRLLRVTATAEGIAAQLEAVAAECPGPPVRCACLIWKDPYMTASRDTLTSALLEAAGAVNVLADCSGRYPRITVGDVEAAGPEVVLLPSEPYAFSQEDVEELGGQLPGAHVLRIPGEWVTWYGSRMSSSIRSLRAVLEPFRRPG